MPFSRVSTHHNGGALNLASGDLTALSSSMQVSIFYGCYSDMWALGNKVILIPVTAIPRTRNHSTVPPPRAVFKSVAVTQSGL